MFYATLMMQRDYSVTARLLFYYSEITCVNDWARKQKTLCVKS